MQAATSPPSLTDVPPASVPCPADPAADRNSLSAILIRKVFPIYLVLAVLLTLVQIVAEYRDSHTTVLREIDSTAQSFEVTVSDALWNYKYYLLPLLADAMVNGGPITGVDIGDDKRLYVIHDPQPPHRLGGIARRIELLQPDAQGERRSIGYMTLYSDHGVVVDRVKFGVLMTLLGSIVKTAGLWMIMVFFVRRVLTEPLQRLAHQMASIDLAHAPQAPAIELATPSTELAILRDTFNELTQRAVKGRQLAIQKESAEAANLAKSRFLAAASHDLRQPVHAINLYLGALAGQALPPRMQQLLGKTLQCAKTMEEMFRSLLDVSHLDAAHVQPQVRPFSVGAVLERIRVQFEPQAQAKGLALRVAPCAAWVESDPVMVERIVHNFVSNAVRYTPRGRILVGCRRRGDSLRLAVYDTGPGIPPDKQHLIFEEFCQLGNREHDEARGLGLGLAIVERLARLLSLPVSLASQPGRGSVFAVDLPLARRGDGAPALSAPPAAAPAAGAHPTGLRVVVIDDDPQILDATNWLLTHWGCTAVLARSAQEAIAQLAAGGPAAGLIVCDYRLGQARNGIEAIHALRAHCGRRVPALIVTGDSAPQCTREILNSGFRVLYKPIDEDDFRRALMATLAEDGAPVGRGADRDEDGGDGKDGAGP